MNLLETYRRFPDDYACISHLEELRWGNTPRCAYCDGERVGRKGDVNRWNRWNCHECRSTFTVMSDTMFHRTKVPFQTWFLGICLIMNTKKSMSSYELSRDLNMNQKTAWYLITRIRAEMARQDNPILTGIIEMDETYIGGKPRKGRQYKEGEKPKRGRGTKKTPVVAAVERGGRVVAQMATDLSSRSMMDFIMNYIEHEDSVLLTDEYQAYNAVKQIMEHFVINHKEQYVRGFVHTNTIEGFFATLKRSWSGSHHHYQKKNTPLYVAEACYKYNNRNNPDIFWDFLLGCVK